MTQYEVTMDELRTNSLQDWKILASINSLIQDKGIFGELHIERDTERETITMLYQDDEAANVLQVVIDKHEYHIAFSVDKSITIFDFSDVQLLCRCLDCFMEGMKC